MTTKDITLGKAIKPIAVEEFLDYYFYRRVAMLMVPGLIRLKISPNQITTISLLFGLTSAYFIYNLQFIPAALIAMIAIFFDCCDGQVARLTGQSSPFGRILDGFFDFIWVAAFWFGLHLSGYFQALDLNVLPLMIVSAASTVIHCWRFDAIKVKYFEIADPKACEGDLDIYQAFALFKQELKKFNLFSALLALVMAFQMYFFSRGTKTKKTYDLSPEERQKFKDKLSPVINLWSYLGEGHHNTIVLLGALFAPISPYGFITAFLIILVPMNFWWFYCEYKWRVALKGVEIQL